MQIEIRIDESAKEPKVIVLTDKVTDEVNALVKRIYESRPQAVAGFKDDVLEIIQPAEIVRVYCAHQKVYVASERGEYLARLRLYEFEERLDRSVFIRISNSEIVNLKKVRSLDLSYSGTICVRFVDGTTTYASRRYVGRVKQALGI